MEDLDYTYFHKKQGDEPCWRPAADVFETAKALVIHVDLPGVPKEEVKLDLRDSSLYIHGEHRGPKGFEAAASRIRERNIGRFRKIVRLPQEVEHDLDRIKASYLDGLLTIEVPKKSSDTGRKIAID